MNTLVTFERRLVATASLFLGENVPAFIIDQFISEIPAQERESVKAYISATLRQFEAIAPVLKPADFALQRGGLLDCMELANTLNEMFADWNISIGLENLAEREDISVDVILAAYRTAAEAL